MEIPQTPAGDQVRWYLNVMASDMSDLSVVEANAHFEQPLTQSDTELRADWSSRSRRVGQWTLVGVDHDEPFAIVVALATDKDTRYQLRVTVAAKPPHKIVALDWKRIYDFEVVVREATAADGPALADIERRAPIVMGDSQMTFDRSADYLAAARLMEEATVVMAEVDGEPAAVEWAARHRACVGGVEYRMVNYIHLRVAEEHQRKGLWGALVGKLNEKYPGDDELDQGYQCASRQNASIQQAFAGMSNWSVGPVRGVISAAKEAGPADGVRIASREDAQLIVDLVNHTHGQEEMYFPYTLASLSARLERAPELYTWEQIWLTDNAVVGVWPSGSQTTVIKQTDGGITQAKHGLVLDYGFRTGAEAEFKQLLQAWCGWLAEHQHSHLSIFTSGPAMGFDIVQAMAEQVELFDIWTPPIAEPQGAALHGVYVDQVYF